MEIFSQLAFLEIKGKCSTLFVFTAYNFFFNVTVNLITLVQIYRWIILKARLWKSHLPMHSLNGFNVDRSNRTTQARLYGDASIYFPSALCTCSPLFTLLKLDVDRLSKNQKKGKSTLKRIKKKNEFRHLCNSSDILMLMWLFCVMFEITSIHRINLNDVLMLQFRVKLDLLVLEKFINMVYTVFTLHDFINNILQVHV